MANKVHSKKTKKEQAKVNTVIKVLETKITDESKLIVAALGEISPGTQASADFFNQDLPEGHPARVSRTSVWYWANGSKRIDENKLRVWKIIYPPGDKRHQLVLDIFALREKKAQEFLAHWIGSDYPKVKEADLVELDGKKLLKAVRLHTEENKKKVVKV